MRSYLSIDLDFWMNKINSNGSAKFFKKVMKIKKPITFVIEHEELTDEINEYNVDTIYNIDYHSDIIDDKGAKEMKKPMDFCWANYIKYKNRKRYIWIMPNENCYSCDTGLCHAETKNNPFEKNTSNWKQTIHTTNQNNIQWDSIVKIGVSLSPVFVDLCSIDKVFEMINIDITKMEKIVSNQPWDASERKRGVIKKIKRFPLKK